MNTINQTDLSFHSTIVPLNSKKPLIAYFNAIKTCDLKSMQNMPIEECYKELFDGAKKFENVKSGVMLDKDNFNNPVLRFLGFSKGNDEFIFRQLKKVDNNVRYVRDVIDDGFEHETFEILI